MFVLHVYSSNWNWKLLHVYQLLVRLHVLLWYLFLYAVYASEFIR